MSIAKSLRKAGYLSAGIEGLQKFLKGLRDNQAEEELARTSIDTYNKLKELYQPQPNFEEPPQTQPPIHSLLRRKDFTPEIPIEEPSIQIMPDYLSPQEQETQSRSLLGDYLNKISQINGIDQEKVKKEFDLMNLKAGLLQPQKNKKEIKQLDPDRRVIRVDDYGNIEVIQEPQKPKKDFKFNKVGEYVNAEGKKVIMYLDDNGIIKETQSQETVRDESPRTTINLPKPEKWKDFGANLNSINYTTDENNNIIPRPEKEKEQYRQIVINLAKSNLLPEALNWHNNEIIGKWGREDLNFVDYNIEIIKSLERGEISPEAAQDLIDFNIYRVQILGKTDERPIYNGTDKIKK